MIFIHQQEKLIEICKLLETEKLIAVDTEFVRRNTYYPKLSIIQIVTEKLELIIDFLAIEDLLQFNLILQNQNILKIFHSGVQDLEIFFHLFGQLPKNIYDTQIAANLCGYGEAVSYSTLCETCTGNVIDKTHQAADWLKRPLSDSMLEYAINDVRYLIPIYRKLNAIILNSKLEGVLQEKFNKLNNSKNYDINIDKIFKKVRYHKKSDNLISKMQALTLFRETYAREENIPRRRFASDKDLLKLSLNLPLNDEELQNAKISKALIHISKYKSKLYEICSRFRE